MVNSNFEDANIVDVLHQLACAGEKIAGNIASDSECTLASRASDLADAIQEAGANIGCGLERLAGALELLAKKS